VIFPTPEIFRRWMDYPMTMALLVVNTLTFFTFFFSQGDMGFSSDLLEDEQLVYTGKGLSTGVWHCSRTASWALVAAQGENEQRLCWFAYKQQAGLLSITRLSFRES